MYSLNHYSLIVVKLIIKALEKMLNLISEILRGDGKGAS